MGRFTINRLLAPELTRPLSKPACATPTVPQWTRLFSQSRATQNTWTPSQRTPQQQNAATGSPSMNRIVQNVMRSSLKPSEANSESLSETLGVQEDESPEPYHFHIYSHKHNTHITLTKPNRDALLSLSCGNLGFKKSGRKHYDSAYQLGAYAIDKMHQKGLVNKIHKLEVVLRGFGPGREAVVKVLMGNEGKLLRPKITRVADSTRLKFGGTRSPKMRRLG
ncbi:hypothetical protein C8A01DRAFT_44588 [Parachaetomium inaequale]|uniref:Small ribosomal subunit protein uS11m n=1 Tax=Parachaetomium inaequale TaxID=2588326 RepID=A0AAN6PK29_9PEZI|nr:hypothetical protein C8A01DRAFT_44588 [Parachaetomium inaequale]